MRCPHRPSVDVGQTCSHSRCWLWNAESEGACIAAESGTTSLSEVDLARVSGTTPSRANQSVDRGRKLLSAWLRLTEMVAEVHDGCPTCGHAKCSGSKCAEDAKELEIVGRKLPLSAVLEMNAPRWRAAMRAVKKPDMAMLLDLYSGII